MPNNKRQQRKSVPEPQVKEVPIPAMPPLLQRAGIIILIAVFILAPLAYLTPTSKIIFNALDSPRRLVMLLGAGMVTALILFSWASRRRIIYQGHRLDRAVFFFALIALITGLTGQYPRVSFFGPLWDSEIALPVLGICLLLYLGVKEFLREPAEVEFAVLSILVTGAIVSLIGIADYFGWKVWPTFSNDFFQHPFDRTNWMAMILNPAFTGKRLISTMGNPMFTGAYLAMLVPLGVGAAMAVKSWWRWSLIIACECCLFPALMFSQARASWLGLAFTLPIMLLMLLALRGKFTIRWYATLCAMLGLAVTMCVVALLNPKISAKILVRINSITHFKDETVETRAVYMKTSLNMFLARPLQGWGSGNLKPVFPQYRPSSDLTELSIPLNRGYASALPHNLFLQTAAEMGIIGIIALVWLIVAIYRFGIAQLKENHQVAWLSWGLIGMASTYLITTQSSFDNAITIANFWIALGLLAALGAKETLPSGFWKWLAVPVDGAGEVMLRLAGIIVAALFFAATLMQTLAACYTQTGFHYFDKAKTYSKSDIPMARDAMLNVEDAFIKANAMTPIGDTTCYKDLFLAYRTLRDLDLSRRDEYSEKMYEYGNTALELLEREPLTLRTIIEAYITDCRTYQRNKKGDEAVDALTRANILVQQLVTFEPKSSQVRLLFAVILAQQGKLKGAIEQTKAAQDLDPGYVDVYARLARYQHALVFRDSSLTQDEANRLIREAYKNFKIALGMGYHMNTEEVNEYQDTIVRYQALK